FRLSGTLLLPIFIQLSVLGLYLPPLLRLGKGPRYPPQTIISVPVQTTVCAFRPSGALVVLVAVQLSISGLYLPPVLKLKLPMVALAPPQTIISVPVHNAVCKTRASGAF